MSSKLNDAKVLYTTMAITPTVAIATSITSPALDMATVGNNQCFAMQMVGIPTGTETVFIGNIQESPNTTAASFTNVTAFSTVTSSTGANGVQVVSFQRKERFLRFSGTIIGTTANVSLAVLIGGQKNEMT